MNPSSASRAPQGPRRPQPHVLIIDDTPAVLALLAELFTDEGCRVSTSAASLSPTELQQAAPDVVVHDVLGSHVSAAGWGQLMRLRADPRLAAMPIVVCTADVRAQSDAALQRDLAALGLPVVAKPFALEEMLAAVWAAWDGASALATLAAAPMPPFAAPHGEPPPAAGWAMPGIG